MLVNKHKDISLFSAINKVLSHLFDDSDLYLIKIIEDWKNITPQTWLNTYPIRIIWSKNNTGTLVVGIDDNYLLNLLVYDVPNIVDKINEYFGYKCIDKIKLIKI